MSAPTRERGMRTLGLLGGMSWESTLPYYRFMNEAVRRRLGGLHSARLLLASVDFAEVEASMRAGRWDEAGALLAGLARTLEHGGAEALVLCTNTLHRVAPAIESAVSIPLLHIVDPTAEAARRLGLNRLGLLGTRFTMESAFYAERFRRHGLEVLAPGQADREEIHRVIFEELCLGKLVDASRRYYLSVIARLADAGAQGIILGCTEIAMLISQKDSPLPLLDTTALHAEYAVDWALRGREGET
jgi:aspartate racemase